MSAWVCGCDPEAQHVCHDYPNCAYGRNLMWEPPKMEPREERIEKLYKDVRSKTLPTDPKARKTYPVYSGVLAYFPDALVEIAHVSFLGNEQHNPGTPLHWDRTKSQDEKDAEVRHLLEPLTIGGAKFDTGGVRHSAKKAWRALADLQKELEAERAQ